MKLLGSLRFVGGGSGTLYPGRSNSHTRSKFSPEHTLLSTQLTRRWKTWSPVKSEVRLALCFLCSDCRSTHSNSSSQGCFSYQGRLHLNSNFQSRFSNSTSLMPSWSQFSCQVSCQLSGDSWAVVQLWEHLGRLAYTHLQWPLFSAMTRILARVWLPSSESIHAGCYQWSKLHLTAFAVSVL